MIAALFMFLTWTQQEMVKWHITVGNNLFGLGEASAWVEVEAASTTDWSAERFKEVNVRYDCAGLLHFHIHLTEAVFKKVQVWGTYVKITKSISARKLMVEILNI